MRELYSNDYVNRYFKLKKRLLTSYFIILIASVLTVAGILLFYALEPYQTNLRFPLMIGMFAVISFFIIYSFMFFTISYGRTRSYCNFLMFSVCAKRSVDKITVLGVYNDLVEKNGVNA